MQRVISLLFILMLCNCGGTFTYKPDFNSTYKIKTGKISCYRNRCCANWEDNTNKRNWILCAEGDERGEGIFFRKYLDK